MLPEPTWLDRAYAKAITPDPDTGALQRSLMVWRVTRRLRALGLVPPGARSLDFGAGKGILLRAMLDDRLDAWGYDPYPQSTFAQERVLSVLPEGPFDLVTMIEVLEHTLDPVGVLRQLGQRLGPDGLMLVTTEFYREGQHGPGWAYLAPESGQHVTIFSAQGFTAAVKAAGLAWIGSLPWGGQPFVHIVARRGLLSGWKWLRLRLRHKRGEHRAKRPQFA
jgi:SAM-dependent methyltransferase